MIRTGVPASITLAQGMLESDFGRSRLAREGNNHFGIKCHNGWTGETIYHNDDRRNDCFRSYENAQKSFFDHSDFLKNGSRYQFLFEIPANDYKSWAHGLKKAGYATNPDYANLLIRKIEQYDLSALDSEYLSSGKKKGNPVNPVRTDNISNKQLTASVGNEVMARVPRVMETNRIQYIIVRDGDTREKIENEFQLLKWELPKYNELGPDFVPVQGQILYLQPKREKAEPGKEYYTSVEGDTMYLISQKFGIRLKSIYEMNRMALGTEPEAGRKIWLRAVKPVN